MATARKTKPEFDFDAALAAYDEDAAIERLAEEAKVEYVVVENRFIGRFRDHETLEVPLKVSVETVDGLESVSSNPVDQLKSLLSAIGGKTTADELIRRDLVEVTAFAATYFGVLQRVVKASLPES